MLEPDFCPKCIVVHFWGQKNTGKAFNAEFAETQRKDRRVRSEKTGRKDSRSENVSYAAGPFRVRSGMAPTIFPLSPLLAHTSQNRVGWGYDFFQKWVIGSAGAWWLRVRKQRAWGDGRYSAPGVSGQKSQGAVAPENVPSFPSEGRGGRITGRLSRR